jgi:stress-induced morphogen
MAMAADDIARLIKERFPTIVSEAFRGKTRVQQHQMVYDALKENIGGALHALALKTAAP